MQLLDGKLLSNKIMNDLQEEVKGYAEKITLACIIVGDDPASEIYVGNKQKACAQLGMNSIVVRLDKNSSQQDVIDKIESLNKDPKISGILLQLPLPREGGFDERAIINHISPLKDVDALTDKSLGQLFSGKQYVAPCTAQGIITMLDQYGIEIQGKKVVVVGRSLLVGKSVANLLEQRNGTVTICHSRTQNLKAETSQADILVVAIGKPQFITEECVKEGAVVVDVGINRIYNEVTLPDGTIELQKKIVGDVDFEHVAPKCTFITPVPGGVGKMTIVELMRNTINLHKLQEYIHQDDNEDN